MKLYKHDVLYNFIHTPHQDRNTVKSAKFEQNEKSSKKVKKVLDMVSVVCYNTPHHDKHDLMYNFHTYTPSRRKQGEIL